MIYLLIFFSLLYLKTQKGQEFTTCKSETLPKNIVFDKEVEKLYDFMSVLPLTADFLQLIAALFTSF
ncbi:hypothetical protein D1155_06925 [Anaerotruncus sp. 80]|uniref:Uncharacterized protein n=1 Tax=Anaerotruncus colihominis TaxID=169435 RepID=A0A845QJW4_9FIRM|nr:hypothetical protein [Anaerotruncus colihominis]NCF02036.1 hypothetical protein [Anaerotruncus sp. 80]